MPNLRSFIAPLFRTPLAAASSATALVFFAVLAVAPAASALEIRLDPTDAFDLGDGVILQTEVRVEKVPLGLFGGGTMEFEKIIRTIEFRNGPVAVHGFEKRGRFDVAVQSVGTDTLERLAFAPRREPLRVERIRLRGLAFGGRLGSLHLDLGLDLRDDLGSSAPVPEPAAALLFGAGLVAVASTRAARERRTTARDDTRSRGDC